MSFCPINRGLGIKPAATQSADGKTRTMSMAQFTKSYESVSLSATAAKKIAESAQGAPSSDAITFHAENRDTGERYNVEFICKNDVRLTKLDTPAPEWKEKQVFQKRLVNVLRILTGGIALSAFAAIAALIFAYRNSHKVSAPKPV